MPYLPKFVNAMNQRRELFVTTASSSASISIIQNDDQGMTEIKRAKRKLKERIDVEKPVSHLSFF